MPLPLVLAALAFGLWIFWRCAAKKSGFYCVAAALALLVACGTSLVPRLLLLPLERRYPVFTLERLPNPEKIHYIVVLGGGHVVDLTLPAVSRLNPSSLERVAEALRVHRLLPGRKLVFSGGAVMARGPVGESMAAAAMEMGVAAADIVVETTSLDTDDQARILTRMLGRDPFVLVSSASHMPRSMRLFEAAGARPVAAPAGHLLKTGGGIFSIGDVLPAGGGIVASERAFYELLGLGWCWMKEIWVFRGQYI